MRFRRFAGSAALVTACLLAISGCNGDSPEGTTLTGNGDGAATSTPSTTAAKPATPTPTQTPTQAEKDESEEQRLIRDFMASLNTMTASGDTKPFLSMCTSKSRGCSVAAKSIADVYRAGGSYDGPTYRITEWAMVPTGKDPVKVQAWVSWSAYQYTEEKGSAPKSGKAGSDLYEFHLVREGSTWKVQEYFVP